jgi:hypothetical protein
MVVWGGFGSSQLDTGGQYDPAMDSWKATSTIGAPSARANPTVVWTGSRMIVWGGADSSGGALNTGGQYDPAADTWTATSVAPGVPFWRLYYSAVWTGSRMIVWGGTSPGGGCMNTGGQYDPAGDSWTAMITARAPCSSNHRAVWTGSEMIVWGGLDHNNTLLNTGGLWRTQALSLYAKN